MKHPLSRPCQHIDCSDRAAFSDGMQWSYCRRHLQLFKVGPYYKPKEGNSLSDTSPDLTDWSEPKLKLPDTVNKSIFSPKYDEIPLRYQHKSKPTPMSEHEVAFRKQEHLAYQRAQLKLKANLNRNLNTEVSLKDKTRSGNNPL